MRSAFAAFPDALSTLPAGWLLLTENARAQVSLQNKAGDGLLYRTLHEAALRCAPET